MEAYRILLASLTIIAAWAIFSLNNDCTNPYIRVWQWHARAGIRSCNIQDVAKKAQLSLVCNWKVKLHQCNPFLHVWIMKLSFRLIKTNLSCCDQYVAGNDCGLQRRCMVPKLIVQLLAIGGIG